MKEQVIETAGKAWRFLGQQGEADIATISKSLKENDRVVLQAIGWLAREDKINYAEKNNKIFVSLVASELETFKSMMPGIPSAENTIKPARRSAKRI
jgi:hypothetical protein